LLLVSSGIIIILPMTTTAAFAAPITGTNGNDVLKGTDSRDTIRARGGDDRVYGFKGNDALYGGRVNYETRREESPRRDSDPRPKVYETFALPG
jgi:hypothetical protein